MSKEKRLSFRKVAQDRLGESRINNQGEVMFIVEYADSQNITVQFKNTGELVKTTYLVFKKGLVKSHFTPSVFGVGYLGYEKSKDENNDIEEIILGADGTKKEFISVDLQKEICPLAENDGKNGDNHIKMVGKDVYK